MESDNLNSGDESFPSPEPSGTAENVAGAAKTKRRKRGKGKPLTHYKAGSRGGRRSKSNASCSSNASTDGGSLSLPDLSANSNLPSDEQADGGWRNVLCPPTATSSPFSTAKKFGDLPGAEAHLPGPSTQNTDVPSVSSKVPSVSDQLPQYADQPGPSTECADASSLLCSSDSNVIGGVGVDDEGHLFQIEADHSEISRLRVIELSNLPDCPSKEIDSVISGSPQLIDQTSSELRRMLHLPLLILPEDNGINVLLLSRCQERTVQRRAFFSIDGKEEVSVHTKTLPAEILNDILQEDINCCKVPLTEATQNAFVQRVVTVVKRLRSYEVCVGVDDSQLETLWEMETANGDIDKNPYKEARYSKTFRPAGCQLLVSIKKYTKRLCQCCIRVKMRFKAKLPHHLTSDFAPNTPNVHLDRRQLITKVEKQQKDLQYARAQIAKMKEQLNIAIKRDGVDINEDLNDDLCSILDSANLTPVQALFFEQQLKAVSVKDARRRRWHPTLIRFALLLKSTSTAAFRAVKDSGLIVLPSERTLYEYSHAVAPEAGCTSAKLDRVCKRIVDLYPEAYQKYHVLLMDEMHINKRLVFIKSSGEMIGYVNVSSAQNELLLLEAELKGEKISDTPPIASKIQAYMIKGVATAVTEVVGTYPTADAFDCEEMYDMTWEVIGALERSGLKVIAIVSDGAAVNRAFYSCHVPLTKTSSGVIFDTVNLCAPSRPLYFFADVPHLLKTIRNCFHKSGTGRSCTRLLTLNGQVIVWQTIRKLYEEDKGNTIRRCFKLNAENVYLNSFTVMKVNYAAQVLSNTVALDLESRHWPGTSETAKFIKVVNDFFDMLNGASSYEGKRKANPNLDPYVNVNDERFDKLLSFLGYLNEWKEQVEMKEGFTNDERAKMMLSRQTLQGIEMTVLAFIGATKFLLSESLKFINARVFCQDPLERYFSKQRQCGGGSRNPPAAQVFRNEAKINIHRDMNVRRSNVSSQIQSMEVSDDPVPKRKRSK